MTIEFCEEHIYDITKGLQPCVNPSKATVRYTHGSQRRVCGIHARMHERLLEDVRWDQKTDAGEPDNPGGDLPTTPLLRRSSWTHDPDER